MKNSGDKIIREQVDNMQVSFDKEAAWMKLQDRLESKDEQNEYYRVGWVAAAVLLVATMLWYSLASDTKRPVVNTTPKALQPVSIEEPKNEIAEPIVKTKNNKIAQHKKVKVAVVKQAIKEQVKEKTPEPIIVQEEIVPTQEMPKVVSAPKPKMKVVHINEVMQDRERARIMRDIYVIEEEMLKKSRNYEPHEDINASKPQSPFKTNRIIQN